MCSQVFMGIFCPQSVAIDGPFGTASEVRAKGGEMYHGGIHSEHVQK